MASEYASDKVASTHCFNLLALSFTRNDAIIGYYAVYFHANMTNQETCALVLKQVN